MMSEFRSDVQTGRDPAQPADGPPAPPTEAPPTSIRLRGRVVGLVSEGVFRRRLRPEHYLHHPPAIALHDDVVSQLAALDVDVLEFVDIQTGEIRATGFNRFVDRSFVYRSPGYGSQRAMLLTDFHQVTIESIPLQGLDAVYSAFAGVDDE